MDILNPAINDYVLTHSSPADAVLCDLAAETLEVAPEWASMQISHDEGELLTMLARLVGARQAVEVGVFTGYSSICIARGMPKDGYLLACDVSDEWSAIAQRYWERAGLADRIDLRIAPAAETLRQLPREEALDFAFIDADKSNYALYFEELIVRLRPGGVIAADNVLRGGRVVDPSFDDEATIAMRKFNDMVVADQRVDTVILPVRDGVTLARKR